ncbi:hypothetical protein [Aquimarina brevivitae]|uniref:Uncharacterized protein n=1 Tax=Aquimarina brevivitae TaxID=323412 RepID=A0A4Q7PEY3_9FLAO|nr:hypothetical protein [Aquimarina brevivitae]RZS99033.1 hypothetical protein EV197_0237 [Aquimarina brevivitae]
MEQNSTKSEAVKPWYLHRSKIVIILITVGLIALSFYGYFHQQATDFLTKVSGRISESSDFITVINKGLSYVASLNIPVVDGYATDVEKDLTKVSNYLTIAHILVKLQVLLLKLSNMMFFKILALVLIVGLFFEKHKKTAFKLLMICLLINPGLSIYVNLIHKTATVTKLNLGVDLHQKLSEIKLDFTKKEQELKDKQDKRKAKQLAAAEKKGKDHISFFKKAEDAVLDTVEDAGAKVKEEVKLAEEIVTIDTESLLVHLVNLITAIALLYLLLPLLYFYIMNLVLKNVLQFSLNDIVDSIL